MSNKTQKEINRLASTNVLNDEEQEFEDKPTWWPEDTPRPKIINNARDSEGGLLKKNQCVHVSQSKSSKKKRQVTPSSSLRVETKPDILEDIEEDVVVRALANVTQISSSSRTSLTSLSNPFENFDWDGEYEQNEQEIDRTHHGYLSKPLDAPTDRPPEDPSVESYSNATFMPKLKAHHIEPVIKDDVELCSISRLEMRNVANFETKTTSNNADDLNATVDKASETNVQFLNFIETRSKSTETELTSSETASSLSGVENGAKERDELPEYLLAGNEHIGSFRRPRIEEVKETNHSAEVGDVSSEHDHDNDNHEEQDDEQDRKQDEEQDGEQDEEQDGEQDEEQDGEQDEEQDGKQEEGGMHEGPQSEDTDAGEDISANHQAEPTTQIAETTQKLAMDVLKNPHADVQSIIESTNTISDLNSLSNNSLIKRLTYQIRTRESRIIVEQQRAARLEEELDNAQREFEAADEEAHERINTMHSATAEAKDQIDFLTHNRDENKRTNIVIRKENQHHRNEIKQLKQQLSFMLAEYRHTVSSAQGLDKIKSNHELAKADPQCAQCLSLRDSIGQILQASKRERDKVKAGNATLEAANGILQVANETLEAASKTSEAALADVTLRFNTLDCKLKAKSGQAFTQNSRQVATAFSECPAVLREMYKADNSDFVFSQNLHRSIEGLRMIVSDMPKKPAMGPFPYELRTILS